MTAGLFGVRAWDDVTTSPGSAVTPSSFRWLETCSGVRDALLVMNATCVLPRRAAAMLSAACATARPST